MVFCNVDQLKPNLKLFTVTILILVDGFLQYKQTILHKEDKGHNPYFSRWFSAMQV